MPIARINDLDMYYEMAGQGPPLLLLHGLGANLRNWDSQIQYFMKDYQVITCDLRGHGRSTKPKGPYRMRLFAEDTAALLQVLDVQAAHIAGTSMGGMVAFELAIRYPQLLKSLIVVNCVPDMRIKSLWEYFDMWQKTLILKVLESRRVGAILSRQLFPKPDQEKLRQIFVEEWVQNDKQANQAALQAVFGWSVESHLGEIICPVLMIASEYDHWPLEEKRMYVAKIPNARLTVIEDAHHAVAIERPDRFNQALDEFLDSLHGLV